MYVRAIELQATEPSVVRNVRPRYHTVTHGHARDTRVYCVQSTEYTFLAPISLKAQTAHRQQVRLRCRVRVRESIGVPHVLLLLATLLVLILRLLILRLLFYLIIIILITAAPDAPAASDGRDAVGARNLSAPTDPHVPAKQPALTQKRIEQPRRRAVRAGRALAPRAAGSEGGFSGCTLGDDHEVDVGALTHD